METVGQLTGGVAHDFNNLLTAVIGSLSLIGQITTDARVKRLVDTAQRAANRGAKLTAHLLAFSRRQNLRPQTSDLNELIAVFDPLLRRALGEMIGFDTDFGAGLWQVEVDQAQFQSALLNLVINARDAMPNGGTLRVETRNVELDVARAQALKEIGPGNYAVVAVIDSGEGMPPEVLARAIEPFYTTKEIGKGSGLGLSQVYGFARQSNGQVKIDSEPGKGTAVRIYLPRSANCTVGTWGADAAEAGAARKPVVLAVEDDPEVLDVTVETLRSLGYQVLSAVDARDALTVLERDVPIDVLFTDIVMPKGMDGVELARAARRLRPGLRVILASGYTREGLRIREEIGEDIVFLGKPYQLGELADTLRGLTAAE
jgi:CheY-like chemotaxis protein